MVQDTSGRISTGPELARAAALVLAACATGGAAIADENADRARELANPLTRLINIPYSFDYDEGYSHGDGGQTIIAISPSIPFSLGDSWDLVTHTSFPFVWNDSNWVGDAADDVGLGDIATDLLLTPKGSAADDLAWGLGLSLLFPTATEDSVGRGQMAAGPKAVIVKRSGALTFGGEISHLWSTVGSDDDRRGYDVTYIEPFIAYVSPQATTFELGTEAFYDWDDGQWGLPLILEVSQTFSIWGQPVQIGAGAKYWASSTDHSADDWGLRLTATFLYP